MKIVQISQIGNFKKVIEECDILICGCGYEERCIAFVKEHIDVLKKVQHKYAFSYTSPKVQKLEEHKNYFSHMNFYLHHIVKQEDIDASLEKIFEENSDKAQLKILVDYSSMERQWYSRILNFLSKYRNHTILNLFCCFTYCIPEFTSDSSDKKFAINGIEALPGFSSISIPDKPTALIVGLGTNEKALASLRYFADIDYIHYFYTNSSYVPNLKDKYHMLWNRYAPEQMHEYELKNMVPVFNSLCDIYNSLKDEYRLVIISCGPKPFTLMSLLFAQIYGIDVWYMKNNLSTHYIPKKSLGDYITFGIEYIGI